VVKLNIGSGGDYRDDYINIDIRKDIRVDIVATGEHLCFGDNSVDEILAKDVIEHFSFRVTKAVLREWYRVLKAGGKLHIQCPDIRAIVDMYMSGKIEPKDLSYWIFGEQNYKENIHRACFDKEYMYEILHEVGFKNIKINNDGGSNLIVVAEK